MNKKPDQLSIHFEPTGRRIDIPAGETILSAAQRMDAGLIATCGGQGTCLDCKIKLISGICNALTPSEVENLSSAEIAENIRLACQAIPASDMSIELPVESVSARQRLQIEVQSSPLVLDPPTRVVRFEFSDKTTWPEALSTLANAKSLVLSADTLNLVRPVIENLPSDKQHLQLIVRDQEIVGCLEEGLPLGLAIDVGSTKLAAYLVNLIDGRVLASEGSINPQVAYGDDIISRISYANQSPDHEYRLRDVLHDAISKLCVELCTRANAQPNQVIDVVLVGNSVIQHFLAGFPVRSLGEAPFTPYQSHAFRIPAAEIGLKIHPAACIYFPPLIAGYVGGDHIAMLLASGCYPSADRILAMDIGTNTEISLVVNGKIFSCSCASGPAFEGARIREGMRAASGAIERVRQHDGQIWIQTVDQRPPVGICGSGILDAIVVMKEIHAIDQRGVLNKEHPEVHEFRGQKAFSLTESTAREGVTQVRIYRQDIQEIQLAKSAIRTGCDILLEQAGLQPGDIDQMLVAGAFGTYLSIESALKIGMFPPIPIDRIQQIGNAAGKGAQMLLCSQSARHQASEIANNANIVALNRQTDFADRFTQNLQFD